MKQQELTASMPLPTKVISHMADLMAKAIVERMPKQMFKTKKRKKKSKYTHPVFLDTSAIIDGRIAEVIKLGFVLGDIVIADFILNELKHVSDSQDLQKRARGRRGLDLLDQVKKTRGIKFSIYETGESPSDNDEALLKLAKRMKARLITTDLGLNKKASIQGVRVLNVNDLANVLRSVVLPGEEMKLKIVGPGKNKNQGVGYLKDGTMIVIEDGGSKVGSEVPVAVSRVLQTPAGKMIFARLKTK